MTILKGHTVNGIRNTADFSLGGSPVPNKIDRLHKTCKCDGNQDQVPADLHQKVLNWIPPFSFTTLTFFTTFFKNGFDPGLGIRMFFEGRIQISLFFLTAGSRTLVCSQK